MNASSHPPRAVRTRVGVTLFLVALLGTFIAPRGANAAGMLIADGGLGGALEIKEHNVHVTINNGIAVTEVTQIFQNTENRQVEGLYTFPVPKGASVANFSMWIGGKEMVGEVLEKKHARQIYDSYKQQRRDPGLLEQTSYRTFEMRVFPIGPKAEQKVKVTYYQELDFDNDWATYVYPLATRTRSDIQSKTTGKFSVQVDARSEVPIVAMESPSHPKDFAVARQSDSYYNASLESRGGDLNRDVIVAYHLARPHTGVDMITSRQGSEDGYFSLTLTAGEELAELNKAMDYVFVLDISGSMNDDGKLDLSRKSLGAFINALGEQDRFELMTFNVQPDMLFKESVLATADNKKKALEFLATREARGGTVLKSTMSAAYRYADKSRPLNVVLLSDGLTEQGENSELMTLVASRPEGTRVFTIGVGNDVNRGLLESMAQRSGGLAAFLSPDDNLDRQALAFRRKLMRPVATDLKINFTGGEIYDLEPKELPNLYHGMPVHLYGRYKSAGAVQVSIEGNIAGTPLKKTVAMDLPKADAGNPEIERMWAWHKIDRLLKESDAAGSRAGAVDEIVRLGEGYSIVTEYTSFLVLGNDAEYQRWKIDRKNALRIERDRKAQTELASKLETMRDKAADSLGPAALEPKAMDNVATAQPLAQGSAPAPSMSSPVQPQSSGGAPQISSPHANSRDRGNGGGAVDPTMAGAFALLVGLAIASFVDQQRTRGGRSAK